jgi:hypothetical protein
MWCGSKARAFVKALQALAPEPDSSLEISNIGFRQVNDKTHQSKIYCGIDDAVRLWFSTCA